MMLTKLKSLFRPKFQVDTDEAGNNLINLPDGKKILVTPENQVTVIGDCNVNVEGTYTVDADEIVLRSQNDFAIVGKMVYINSEPARMRSKIQLKTSLSLPEQVTLEKK